MLEKHFGSHQGPCSYKVITINPSIPRNCIPLTNGSPWTTSQPSPPTSTLWIVRTPCQVMHGCNGAQAGWETAPWGLQDAGLESALNEACGQQCGDSLPGVHSSGLVGQLCHHRPHNFPSPGLCFLLRPRGSVCLRAQITVRSQCKASAWPHTFQPRSLEALELGWGLLFFFTFDTANTIYSDLWIFLYLRVYFPVLLGVDGSQTS